MTKIAVAAGSLLVPLALLYWNSALNSGGNSWLIDHGSLVKNWLYMAAPQLIVMAISVAVKAARKDFLPWALGMQSLALVVFQCWIWWFVPPRESGLAWVIYIPVSVTILVLVAAVSLWWARFNNSLQRTPSAPAELNR